MTRQTAQAHRINIEAGQPSVFEALSTAEGWSRWFTPEVTGDFTDGSQIVCRLNGRSPIRLRVTSVQPGPAIAFEALQGLFAAGRGGRDQRRPVGWHQLLRHRAGVRVRPLRAAARPGAGCARPGTRW